MWGQGADNTAPTGEEIVRFVTILTTQENFCSEWTSLVLICYALDKDPSLLTSLDNVCYVLLRN